LTNVILQGGTPFDKTVAGVAALDTLWTVKQSLTHVHFAWFNGTNADGSWKPLPLAHPPANEPYFPLSIADASWKAGQLLLLTWGSHNLNVGGKKVRVELADLLAHKYDPYLIAQAHTLRDWKHPIVIALNAEFNYQRQPGISTRLTSSCSGVTWSIFSVTRVPATSPGPGSQTTSPAAKI
jgi:hypothetical protein